MKSLLEKILEETETSHSKFAKDVDVTKTYVISILKGSKPLSENIYKRMTQLDYIRPYADELTEYFMTQKFGKKQYSLIKHFFDDAKGFFLETVYPSPAKFEGEFPSENSTLTKENFLSISVALFKNAITESTPFITNYPFSMKELDDVLFATAKENRVPSSNSIFHLIRIGDTITTEIIDTYWKSLQWGTANVLTYVADSGNSNYLMPYYIFTDDLLITFSENYEHICVFNGKNVCSVYKEAFDSVKKHPLTMIVYDETALLNQSAQVSAEKGNYIDWSLPPAGLYDYDTIRAATTDIYPDEVYDALTKGFLNYYNTYVNQKNKIFLVGIEAVKDFMKTGKNYAVSDRFLNPFSVEARKTIVSRLKNLDGLHLVKNKIELPIGYIMDIIDNRVFSQFLMTPYSSEIYSIYCVFEKSSLKDLDLFIDNLVKYISFDMHLFSKEEQNFLIDQFSIMGDIALGN